MIAAVGRVRRNASKVVGAGSVVVLALGVAFAGLSAAATAPVTFKACLGGGALYHVTTGVTPKCKTGDKHVSWNSTGPRGPQGLAGVTGAQGAAGAQGPDGPLGPIGPKGDAGANGSNGANGTNGSNGRDGNTVLNGAGDPPATLGSPGDFYLDTSTYTMWGPKTAGGWPASGTALVPPAPPECTLAPTVQSASAQDVPNFTPGVVYINDPVQLRVDQWTAPACTGNASVAYSWSISSAPSGSHATIDFPSSASPQFTPDVVGTYRIGLVLTAYGQDSQPFYLNVTTSPCGGFAPYAPAHVTQADGSVVMLWSDYPSDFDNTSNCPVQFQGVTFSWSWSLLDAPPGASATIVGADRKSSWIDLTNQPSGSYAVRLTVRASSGTSAISETTFSWNGTNITT